DDLVEGVRLLMDVVPDGPANRGAAIPGDSLSPVAPYRVVNIGNSDPISLMDFISEIEAGLGQTAHKNFMEMQPGDVPATWADTELLRALTGYAPKTSLEDGVSAFVAWYRDYYGV
ncbi:MAG: UDP-glucuronate 5-epimerase, partial [Pseudomonadota bacterium]